MGKSYMSRGFFFLIRCRSMFRFASVSLDDSQSLPNKKEDNFEIGNVMVPVGTFFFFFGIHGQVGTWGRLYQWNVKDQGECGIVQNFWLVQYKKGWSMDPFRAQVDRTEIDCLFLMMIYETVKQRYVKLFFSYSVHSGVCQSVFFLLRS